MLVRDARLSDAEGLLKIYAPYVKDTAVTFEYEVPSTEEFEKRISTISEKYPYLVLEENGEIVGYAYAHEFYGRKAYEWSCEVTIYLSRNERGKGYGKILYDELEKRLGEMGVLNLNSCIAYTDREDSHLTNASMYFHKKMGYTECARFHQSGYKFDTWYDVIWMEKMIGSHLEKQPEVKFVNNKK